MPGITQPATQVAQNLQSGVFQPNADGRFVPPPGYIFTREHENHTMRNAATGVPLSATVNAMSVRGMAAVVPPAASTLITACTGWSAPAASLQATLQAVLIAASGSGVFMAYNATASASSVPVPTNGIMIPINYGDLILMKYYGNASATVSIIMLGFVPPI